MKSPKELSLKLARQWENADLRENRLLEEPDAWPIMLPIGKPPPAAVQDNIGLVRQHFETWRSVSIGDVVWKESSYRSVDSPVRYPAEWVLHNPAEWVAACEDKKITHQYRLLSRFFKVAKPESHSLLIRRRRLWSDCDSEEIEKVLRIVDELYPGMAEGIPLRALSLAENDTKFFERNERLLVALLDIRFDGEATRQGLEAFLGASSNRGHWLLVYDLDGSLLPFEQFRVRAAELSKRSLPGKHLLIVENENCLHQLSELPDTLAILGAGFDLAWTAAEWLREKNVAYWGDLDTWGLYLLGRARMNIPDLTPILMTQMVFDANVRQAVAEKTLAEIPENWPLTPTEKQLYFDLVKRPVGRLEQEFIPVKTVYESLKEWFNSTKSESLK